MDDRPRSPGGVIGRAFANFFRDLLAGDLVALGICFGLVLFVAAIFALGAWFLWQRHQAAEQFKRKVAEKRKKEDAQYKASKKPKEI